jgi:hypothetical protein
MKMIVLMILVIILLDAALILLLIVKIMTSVLKIIATLEFVDMMKLTVMIGMLALLIIVYPILDVFLLLKTVMIITHVPKMIVTG